MWFLKVVATSFLLNEAAAFTPSRYGLNAVNHLMKLNVEKKMESCQSCIIYGTD